MVTQQNIQTIEEPPTEYYLLDCEFATELNYQSKTTRNVPLEIAIGHHLNGKCLGYLAEYLYWPNMLARNLKRGIKHSSYSFDEYLKKGQVANIVEELNAFIKRLSQHASAITINKGETLAKSSAPVDQKAIPFDLKLMDGRILPSVQLPRTIRYIICTARNHQMTKNQTKQLNTWLVGIDAHHRMVQCTKPSQASFGIFVGDAKSYHQLRED